jgi:uncharacterized protein YaaQ
MAETSNIHAMVMVVIQEQDIDLVTQALTEMRLPFERLSSVGGFLGRRNATLFIGLPDGMADDLNDRLQTSCRQRIEYVTIPLEGSPLPMPTPVPVTVGGANLFTLPVERFEEF